MADVVVITGGSAGIGRASARQFAARGCAVGLIARGQERLDSEEVVRALVRKCCGGQRAPQSLRQRISVQITSTEITWG